LIAAADAAQTAIDTTSVNTIPYCLMTVSSRTMLDLHEGLVAATVRRLVNHCQQPAPARLHKQWATPDMLSETGIRSRRRLLPSQARILRSTGTAPHESSGHF
jgi:hypothetical protein